jgi:hypothetical protein
MNDAVNSLRIVLAADESIRTKRAVNLGGSKPAARKAKRKPARAAPRRAAPKRKAAKRRAG